MIVGCHLRAVASCSGCAEYRFAISSLVSFRVEFTLACMTPWSFFKCSIRNSRSRRPAPAHASKVGPTAGLVNSPGPRVRLPVAGLTGRRASSQCTRTRSLIRRTGRHGTELARASQIFGDVRPAGAEQSPNFPPRWNVIDANRYKPATALPFWSATTVGAVGNLAHDRAGGTRNLDKITFIIRLIICIS